MSKRKPCPNCGETGQILEGTWDGNGAFHCANDKCRLPVQLWPKWAAALELCQEVHEAEGFAEWKVLARRAFESKP